MVLACPAGLHVLVAGCMESIAWRRDCEGGKSWAAIVAVSWVCLYSYAMNSLCSVYNIASRRYLRTCGGEATEGMALDGTCVAGGLI